jgi:hypothetical protein
MSFDAVGLSGLSIALIRRLGVSFEDVRRQLMHAISSNHGPGQPQYKSGNEIHKRWKDGDAVIKLLAVNDPIYPVLSVDFSTTPGLKTVLWHYKHGLPD